jgi:hypothetical protein
MFRYTLFIFGLVKVHEKPHRIKICKMTRKDWGHDSEPIDIPLYGTLYLNIHDRASSRQ